MGWIKSASRATTQGLPPTTETRTSPAAALRTELWNVPSTNGRTRTGANVGATRAANRAPSPASPAATR